MIVGEGGRGKGLAYIMRAFDSLLVDIKPCQPRPLQYQINIIGRCQVQMSFFPFPRFVLVFTGLGLSENLESKKTPTLYEWMLRIESISVSVLGNMIGGDEKYKVDHQRGALSSY